MPIKSLLVSTETHFSVLDIVAGECKCALEIMVFVIPVMTEDGGNEEAIELMMEDDEVAYRAAVFLSLCHRVAAISPSDSFVDAWEALKRVGGAARFH